MSAQASDFLSPEEIFKNDNEIKSIINKAEQEGYEIEEPTKVFLKGHGGIVGYIETYLVGVKVKQKQVNPHDWSITAIVKVLNGRKYGEITIIINK